MAVDEPISVADINRAVPAVGLDLDNSFFAARIARIPESENAYVHAMASLGPGPHRSGSVAEQLGEPASRVSGFRSRLIEEGLIFSPRYVWVEFAIPHFDTYLLRALPTEHS